MIFCNIGAPGANGSRASRIDPRDPVRSSERPHGVAKQLTPPPTKTSGKNAEKHNLVESIFLSGKFRQKQIIVDKNCFCRKSSGKKHTLAGTFPTKADSCRQFYPTKQNLVDKNVLCRIKVYSCRQNQEFVDKNLLCRTFDRQDHT